MRSINQRYAIDTYLMQKFDVLESQSGGKEKGEDVSAVDIIRARGRGRTEDKRQFSRCQRKEHNIAPLNLLIRFEIKQQTEMRRTNATPSPLPIAEKNSRARPETIWNPSDINIP